MTDKETQLGLGIVLVLASGTLVALGKLPYESAMGLWYVICGYLFGRTYSGNGYTLPERKDDEKRD